MDDKIESQGTKRKVWINIRKDGKIWRVPGGGAGFLAFLALIAGVAGLGVAIASLDTTRVASNNAVTKKYVDDSIAAIKTTVTIQGDTYYVSNVNDQGVTLAIPSLTLELDIDAPNTNGLQPGDTFTFTDGVRYVIRGNQPIFFLEVATTQPPQLELIANGQTRTLETFFDNSLGFGIPNPGALAGVTVGATNTFGDRLPPSQINWTPGVDYVFWLNQAGFIFGVVYQYYSNGGLGIQPNTSNPAAVTYAFGSQITSVANIDTYSRNQIGTGQVRYGDPTVFTIPNTYRIRQTLN